MKATHIRAAVEEAVGPGAVATHRHNHTGTEKLSFEVLAGDRRLWAKVAADDEEDAALRTWASVSSLLADRHGAPPVLEVLEIAGRTALLFPFLDAEVATRASVRDRYADVQAVLDELHADRHLAERLGEPTNSATVFHDVWVRRLREDLLIIADHVAPDVYDYLATEVEVLAGLVASLTDEVHVAMHGDPWHENVLLGSDRVWLLDWEELSVGDPVVDDAIFLMDARGPRVDDWSISRRYEVARRALMLDAAVDTAADWVENTDPATRVWKKRAFLEGLAAYRSFFTR